MTRDEILNMPAGREMDALVAECVFGLNIILHEGEKWGAVFLRGTPESALQEYTLTPIRHFSTAIAAAWEVVKEMSAKNYWCAMRVYSSHCSAEFYDGQKEKSHAEAPTYELAFAICRAALLAVMETE